MLSADAYNNFRQLGFAVLEPGFFSPTEFSEFKELAYKTVRKEKPEMQSIGVPQILEREPQLAKWILHPSVINLAKNLLGPDVAICASNIFFKRSNSKEIFTWHRDFYIVPGAPASSRNKVINIVIALDEATTDSGCLQYVPGSHLEDIQFSDEKVPHAMAYNAVIKAELLKEKPVAAPLKPNQVVAHNALTVHGSGPNTTGSHRCLVSARFFSTAEDQLLSLYDLHYESAQLVSGKDRSGKNLKKSPFYLL